MPKLFFPRSLARTIAESLPPAKIPEPRQAEPQSSPLFVLSRFFSRYDPTDSCRDRFVAYPSTFLDPPDPPQIAGENGLKE